MIVQIERVYEILAGFAAEDIQLRLHMANAQRQALAEAQGARIDELEGELRIRLEAEGAAATPDLEAVPNEPEPEESDDGDPDGGRRSFDAAADADESS